MDSFECVADHLVDRWKSNPNGIIDNLEQQLYLYFVQVISNLIFFCFNVPKDSPKFFNISPYASFSSSYLRNKNIDVFVQ